jgi:adenylate kinase
LYTRDDDKPEAVMKRIQVYLQETEPLVEYYREAGTLREVNGESSITEVGQAVEEALSR